MPTCQNCGDHFPTRLKIGDKVRTFSKKRKFCLKCSPFGAHNTKDITKYDISDGTKHCPRCDCTLPISQFYGRRTKLGVSTYCKQCALDQTNKRLRLLKQLSIEYKGGHCVLCAYDKYAGSLEFHHQDPTQKDFSISCCRSSSFEKVKRELDKCVLLCSNCHREVHADLAVVPRPGFAPGTLA